MSEQSCRHCGQRIVRINYSLGPRWVHQPAGSAFHDDVTEWCHITVATPTEATS